MLEPPGSFDSLRAHDRAHAHPGRGILHFWMLRNLLFLNEWKV